MSDPILRWPIIVVGLCFLVACGGGSDEAPGPASPQSAPLASARLGPAGGTVETDPSATQGFALRLELPPSALDEATTVTVDAAADPSRGGDWTGQVFELLPDGLSLSGGGFLTLEAPDENGDGLVDGTTVKLAHLGCFGYSPATDSWDELTTLDISHGGTTSLLEHFSMYALRVRPDRLSTGLLVGTTGRSFSTPCVLEPSLSAAPTLVSGPPDMRIIGGQLVWDSPTGGSTTITISDAFGVQEQRDLSFADPDEFVRLLPGEQVAIQGGATRSIDTVAWEYCPLLKFSVSGSGCADPHRANLCGHGQTIQYADYWPVAVEDALGLTSPGVETILHISPSETVFSPVADDLDGSRTTDSYLDFLGAGRPVVDRHLQGAAGSTAANFEAPFLSAWATPTYYWTAGRRTDGAVFLQYWFFYPLNHWRTVHEGDWETCTLFFDSFGRPHRLATSVHYEGRSRCWEDVERAEGPGGTSTHPVLYVANGSHATFMEAGSTGLLFRDDHSGDAFRVIPEDLLPPGAQPTSEFLPLPTTGIRPVPLDPGTREPTAWADFPGRWGDTSGIERLGQVGPQGPPLRLEGVIWRAPWTWASGRFDWPDPVAPLGRLRVEPESSGDCTLPGQLLDDDESTASHYADNWYQLGSGYSGLLTSITLRGYADHTTPYESRIHLDEFSDAGYTQLVEAHVLSLDAPFLGFTVSDVLLAGLDIRLNPDHYYRLRTINDRQNVSVRLKGTRDFGVAMWNAFVRGQGRVEYQYTFYPYLVCGSD